MAEIPLNPARVLDTARSFMSAKVLLSAAELELFTVLGDQALTGTELCKRLGLNARANPDFFDALLSMYFLERDGDGPGARYRNTPETKRFMDKASPDYVGGIVEMFNSRLYGFWGDLTEGLKTGRPQNESKHDPNADTFGTLYADPARLEQFLDALTGISTLNFEMLAETFDFSRYRALCDIGGAAARLSTIVARRHPHLRCVNADLPAVNAIARKRIAAAGLTDRVETVDLDFFKDPFPKADVVTMSMILHDWNLEKKMTLIRKAYDALPSGGAFIVIEHLIDDERRQNVFGLLMSLNMLIEFGDAFDYTAADFSGWCRDVGFKRTEKIELTGVASAGVAYK